jgi:hypothetical protein
LLIPDRRPMMLNRKGCVKLEIRRKGGERETLSSEGGWVLNEALSARDPFDFARLQIEFHVSHRGPCTTYGLIRRKRVLQYRRIAGVGVEAYICDEIAAKCRGT